MARLGRAALAAGLVGASVAAISESGRYRLRRYAVPLLPAGTRPIRILHLSDLHLAPWQERRQRFIAQLATLKPDLVVGTGDFMGHELGLVALRYALEPFSGIPGAFVNGSNDYFAPVVKNPFGYLAGPSREPARPVELDIAALRDLYQRLGWVDLNNAAAVIEVADRRLGLVGVDDAHLGYDQLDVALPALDALPGCEVLLGVTHAPYRRVLDGFARLGVALILAGHTHGGQVRLPEWGGRGGALVTNCDLPRRYARGLHHWRSAGRHSYLEVSAGLGTSIYAPFRVFCPPEASLITLTSQRAAGRVMG